MLRGLFLLFLIVLINDKGLCHKHPNKPFEEQTPEHLNQHLKEFTNKTAENMTSEEKKFYEFKLHDMNDDDSLDGLEILWLMHANEEEENNTNINFGELVSETDEAIKLHDLNFDGYISFTEAHS